jgi:hypothetical protein
VTRWMCGRCPALWSVLYGLGGAVLRGYGNLILEVLREAGGMRFERTLNRMEISVDSCMMLTTHSCPPAQPYREHSSIHTIVAFPFTSFAQVRRQVSSLFRFDEERKWWAS